MATAPRASAGNLCGLGFHVLGRLVGEIAAVLFAVRGLVGHLRNLCVGPLAGGGGFLGVGRLADASAMMPDPVRMLFGGIVCHGPNLPAYDWG